MALAAGAAGNQVFISLQPHHCHPGLLLQVCWPLVGGWGAGEAPLEGICRKPTAPCHPPLTAPARLAHRAQGWPLSNSPLICPFGLPALWEVARTHPVLGCPQADTQAGMSHPRRPPPLPRPCCQSSAEARTRSASSTPFPLLPAMLQP